MSSRKTRSSPPTPYPGEETPPRRGQVLHARSSRAANGATPSVVFMPADRQGSTAPARRGKVVIVGQRSWDGLATGPWRDAYLGNYGEPIAAGTGCPTMICPVPGEYDGERRPRDLHRLSRRAAAARPTTRPITTTSGWPCPISRHGRDGRPAEGRQERDPRRHRRPQQAGHLAYTAAAADPDRIAGVVYMGNESTWESLTDSAWRMVSPAVS